MLKHSSLKWFTIALNEIKTQWKVFVVFFFIMQILLTALISINNFALNLPESINDYIKKYGVNYISAGSMTTDKLEVVSELGDKVSYAFAVMTENIIGADLDKAYMKGDEYIVPTGYAEIYLKSGKNSVINALNESLIEGDKFHEEDNDAYKIWVSDFFMEELNLKCNDEIEVTCYDGSKIKCEIVGVYNFDDIWEAYITTMAVYKSVQGAENFSAQALIIVDDFAQYFKVINILEENFIHYTSEKDEMKSLVMILYTLIAVDFMVLMISVSFICTILKIYHMYRQEFYVILRTQGLAKKDVVGVIVILMEFIYLAAFFVAECFSPLLNSYLKDSIQEIFENLTVELDSFCINDLVILFVGMLLVFVTCVLQQRIFTKDSIKELLNKGYE